MKTIVLLMDSLSRRFLPSYGNHETKTPNIDRLASRSCVFNRHFVGSAPCMPARHDLLTGRLEFLERNWAPIQPFDQTLPDVLRKHGVFSHMCEVYHIPFSAILASRLPSQTDAILIFVRRRMLQTSRFICIAR